MNENIQSEITPISDHERKMMYRVVSPIVINPYDKEDMLLNKNGYAPYIELDELLIIKAKVNKSIEFAINNDVKSANDKCIQDHIDSVSNQPKRKVKRNRSKTTKVYLMVDHNTGLHKIGRSKSPLKRERTLQSEKPTIELIAHWESTTKKEKELHKKYNEKRVRGEWFDLTNQDISEILSQENIVVP